VPSEMNVASGLPGVDTLKVRARAEVRLGPVRLEIRSNEPNFRGFRFFSEILTSPARSPEGGDGPHFTLSLCNLNVDGPWPLQALLAMRDRNYRAKKMSAGYYLTDHFGAPAALISRGTDYWIFAEDFEPILWPYAVKHLLTLYSMSHSMLHLKAAGVAVDGQGALLVGRGGSGKTVLLTQLCRAGAQFLSNTHALVDGEHMLGISTAMRVRPDEFFAPLIAERGLLPCVKAGEYTADPLNDLGWPSARSAPIRSICLVDYKGSENNILRELDWDTAFDYMEQFALAINVYGLKEDIFDALGADVRLFSAEMTRVRTQLRALVQASRCHYLSCDAANPRNLQRILELLRG
jgi:hypothetical protein